MQNRIELLTDLRARYVTAEKDLPDRRLRLGLAEQAVARVLTRIDHASEEDPARLVLPAAVTGPVCTENLIRVDDVMESPKLAE